MASDYWNTDNKRNLFCDEAFSIDGVWWPSYATSADEQIQLLQRQGRLTYKPGKGIELKLIHDSDAQPWESDVIHGRISNRRYGNQYSCIGCIKLLGVDNKTIYSVNTALHGFHLKGIENKEIINYQFTIKHINRWVNNTGFKFTPRIAGREAYTINYDSLATEWKNLGENQNFRIVQTATYPFEPDDFGIIKLQEKVIIEIENINGFAQSINDIYSTISIFSDFFTIASCELANPYSIDIHNPYYRLNPSKESRLLANAYMGNEKPSDYWFEMHKEGFLFTEQELEHDIDFYVNRLQKKYPLLTRPISLFSIASHQNEFTDTAFIFLCQAIESYHRNCCGGSYLPEDEYSKSIYPALVQAIPTNTPPDFKSALKTRLKYAHEFSLRKRIQDLLDKHSEVFGGKLVKLKDLANDIALARNALTHHPIGHDVATRPLVFYSTVLKILFSAAILSEIGFRKDQIAELCQRDIPFQLHLNQIPPKFFGG